MNCWRFLFNYLFYGSSKSDKRKYHTKLPFCNLGKATPLIIFLRVKKQSRCGCHTIYSLSLCLVKTWMQQQKNSGLFHVAKWKLCILLYNSIFTVLFFEETPFSFFPVCLWLLLGWCYFHSLCTGRPNLHLRNTKKLVQLLGHSRLATDSMLEAQTLHKLPVKANLPNYILLKATIVLIHDWRAQTSVEMKKKNKYRLHWTVSRHFLHPQCISLLSLE